MRVDIEFTPGRLSIASGGWNNDYWRQHHNVFRARAYSVP
jgi:hypothetical protein